MPLYIHLSIHFIAAVLSGLAVGYYFKKPLLGVIAGIAGGFLIDLDHVLEYFLVFGPQFSFWMFFHGRQFLNSDQTRIFFHAWELAPLFLLVAFIFRRNKKVFIFLLAFVFAGLVHLISDCFINDYPPRNYSLIYRAQRGFLTEKILSPEQYQEHLDNRRAIGL
ncbi:MAG: hypothetical protein WC146_00285 [Patescibacteria group bacterium]|jgi:hypothetical protein